MKKDHIENQREKAKQMYIDRKGKISYAEIAKELGIRIDTLKKWKMRDNWNQLKQTKKNKSKQTNQIYTKKELAKARNIVVQGGTIKEAAEETNINYSTLRHHAARGNWINERENYIKVVYEQMQEKKGTEHIERRIKTIDYLNVLRTAVINEFATKNKEKKAISKDIMQGFKFAVEAIEKTIDAEARLIGVADINTMLAFEKVKKGGKTQNVVSIFDKLEEVVKESYSGEMGENMDEK